MSRPFLKTGVLLFIIFMLAGVAACKKQQSGAGSAGGRGRGDGMVPVSAVPVIKKDVPVSLRGIGNVRASATVSVKPRVSGLIASVEFREGEDVKKGDVLFQIDPKPFEVALAQAKAALAQLREQAANAQQQAKRYATLGTSGGVAKEQLDQLQSVARAAISGSESAEAEVKEAEIQLAYCTIRSPISGRTGKRMIDAGNVVTANTTELVIVNQIEPIEVVFSVAEQFLAQLSRYMDQGKVKVIATPAGELSRPAEGELTFIDNTVKQASGTIDVKATFANQDKVLWPGRFVDVTMILTTEPDALVVPVGAVQTGQRGNYVFVIKNDQTVEMRSVEMARTLQDEAVIAKGLVAGESVVTDGHLRLFPGARVEVKPPVGAPAQTSVAHAGGAVEKRDTNPPTQ